MPKLTKATIGTVAWQVEWCIDVPVDEYGENDLDNATYRREYYPTEAEAWARAKEVYPSDWFGCVAICELEVVPYEEGHPGWYWEAIGDPEYYSGEE